MASGSIGDEKQPKEKFKWGENCKVYTRKIFRNKNKIEPKPNPTASVIAYTNNDTRADVSRIVEGKVGKIGVGDNVEDRDDWLSNGVVEENEKNEENKLVGMPTGRAETVNLSQPHQNSSPLETVSEDSLTLNRPELAVCNGNDENLANLNPTASVITSTTSDTRGDVGKIGVGDSVKDRDDRLSNGVVEENEKNEENMVVGMPKGQTGTNNLLQPYQNSSRLETVSEDSSTLNQTELAVSNGNDENLANPNPTASVITSTTNDTRGDVVKIGVGDSVKDRDDRLSNGVVEESEKNERDKLAGMPKGGTEMVNFAQPHQNLFRLETVSEDSSTLNRPEMAVSNGRDENLVNGVVSVRPVVRQVEDRVSISVSGASSKEEVRNLKRKLESQLDQVRKMTKRLEAKEIQLCECNADNGIDLDVRGHVSISPLPVFSGGLGKGLSGCMRVNSEMSSIGYSDPRPFRHLSVSVMDSNHGIGDMFEKEKRTPKANQYYRNSEFILGKQKLPLAESNRKSKSAGGKRNGVREVDYGFQIDKQVFKSCGNLLQKLMKHIHGWVFNQPVDVKRLGLHDYFDIIKHPMDLGTVKNQLTKNLYKTPREFAEDVRLTFHNAMTYNPEGQDVHIMAKELLGIFEDKWTSIECEYDRKLRYEMIRTPTSRKTYAPAHAFAPVPVAPPPLVHQPPPFHEVRRYERSQSMPVPPEWRSKPAYSVGRMPAPKKPKAKDVHKRDMTFEEKQRLSTNLQSLPSEKLDDIVRIIKKRNSALSQHDDEIEVDIDSVDAETLWELDRFVTNYKKSLSKNKRKAELASLQARSAATRPYQEALSLSAPANNEGTNENRQDEGNVATSPRDQQEKHSDGGSGTSSSSSDSGSSSSDSDSDSSAGYGSDAGQ